MVLMQYEIKGGAFPVVICQLNDGEQMITEKGSMVWMSPNMEMKTSGGGDALIAFGSSFPGQILALEIGPGNEIILQKAAFLASEPGVQLSMHFNKKLGAGFFGGEGFFNTVLTGPGKIWLQTMPISGVAMSIYPFLPTKGNG